MLLWSRNEWGALLWWESCPGTLRNKDPLRRLSKIKSQLQESLTQRGCTKVLPIWLESKNAEVSILGGHRWCHWGVYLLQSHCSKSFGPISKDGLYIWMNESYYSTLHPLGEGDLFMLGKARDMQSWTVPCYLSPLVGKLWVILSELKEKVK
jgi:hypothetical protein